MPERHALRPMTETRLEGREPGHQAPQHWSRVVEHCPRSISKPTATYNCPGK